MWVEHFPQLDKGLIYLDSAATTLKPRCVVDTMSRFYLEDYATINRSVYESGQRATERYYQSRLAVQRFLGAEAAQEILFTRGTTHSINLLAHSFCAAFLREKEAIVVSEVEHHSNVVPWQMATKRHKGKLLFVRVDDQGQIDVRHLAELLITYSVKLVSIAHISNVTGSVQPIEKIVAMCHAAGSAVAVDGAQAAPHMKIDVQTSDIDFYAFSGHKLYGPTGVGVLYGKRALLEQMPPYEGGGDMITLVTQEKSTYAALPHKFEPGTPAIAEVIGLARALAFLEEVGLEKIHMHEKSLREVAYKKLGALGAKFVGHSESALITFTLPGVHSLDVASLLDCRGIAVRSGHLCSQLAMKRFGIEEALRVSFGLYNSYSDIEALIEALSSIESHLAI